MRMTESVAVILENREALDLTAQQVSELEAIQAEIKSASETLSVEMEAFRQQMRSDEVSREEAREVRTQWQRRGQELMAPYQERIHDLLTEEQQTRLEPIMREQMRRGRRGGGPGGSGGPGAAMGRAYQDGFRAGLRAARQGRGGMGHRSHGLRHRSRTTVPDTSGVSNW
jgi:hypothetical protein